MTPRPSLTGRVVLGALLLGGLSGCFGSGPAAPIPVADAARAPEHIAGALRRAQTTVRERPRSAAAWGRLGELYMAHQFPKEALAAFAEAARLDPQDGRWTYLPAILLEEIDLERAVDLYDQTRKRQPGYVAAQFRHAQVASRLGRLDEAQAELQRLAAQQPRSAAVWLALARLAVAHREFAAAAECLQRANEAAPHTRSILLELARLAALQGDWAEALRHQQSAQDGHAAEPAVEDPWLSEVTALELAGRPAAEKADRYLAQGQLAAATSALEEVVREHPELPRARLNLATALWQQGRLADAEREFAALVARFPDDAAGYLSWGRLLATTGRFPEAEQRLREAVRRKPDSGDACLMLGGLNEQQRRGDQAENWYRRAIRAAPQLSAAHAALGLLLARRGERVEALAELQLAAQLAPTDPAVQSAWQHLQALRDTEPDDTPPISALNISNPP